MTTEQLAAPELSEAQKAIIQSCSHTHSYAEVLELIQAEPSLTASVMYAHARVLRKMPELPIDETRGPLQNTRTVVNEDVLLNVRRGLENLAQYLANVDVPKLSLRDTRNYLASLQGVLSTWESLRYKDKLLEEELRTARWRMQPVVQHLALDG